MSKTIVLTLTFSDLIEMTIDDLNDLVDEMYGEPTSGIDYEPIGLSGGVITILATFDPTPDFGEDD